MCDYQESVTTGQTHTQTDRQTGQSDPYVLLIMLRRRHKKLHECEENVNF